jgi:hypothetical protein
MRNSHLILVRYCELRNFLTVRTYIHTCHVIEFHLQTLVELHACLAHCNVHLNYYYIF